MLDTLSDRKSQLALRRELITRLATEPRNAAVGRLRQVRQARVTVPAAELNPSVLRRLAVIQAADLSSQPAVAESVRKNSELRVHFEYCLLTITRRLAGNRWWHAEFIADDGWYVPGMKRGELVEEPTEEGYGRFLPQALLVVRNVSLTGSWSDEARLTMSNNPISYVGPFLTRTPVSTESSTGTAEQLTVLGAGVQVIGELCSPLPPLPPQSDPELRS
ncbi:hypothetical protein [Actinopolymorpha alba]|uniref:hypothetical protein n=1 Tax=Actinopolymorpha alba TaxID=533267 RepID=UPI00037371DB|nr:hypothetical protein [Actinopolymorpha alba]